eukprot:130891_1
MATDSVQKIEIVSSNAQIDFDAESSWTPVAVHSSKKIQTPSVCSHVSGFIDYLTDESVSTIPVFMKYFAFHECLVLGCGGIYHIQPDIGVLCLSILPGISIIGIFIHFLTIQFDSIIARCTFHSIKHYLIALTVFVIGTCSICLIYHTNTYLSTLVPNTLIPGISTSTQLLIRQFLQFPHNYASFVDEHKPFNYRISFVGSIIAPIIEESFKYLLLSLTFPISFIWSFARNTAKNSASYTHYSVQALFIVFIAMCGGCGIAIMENIGYLAACQWPTTMGYCLPNKNFDILGAGLARGIFSVPFHCVTAGIMADIVCCWMNTNIACFHKNRCLFVLKFILSYPMAIVVPVFFHSSFNYWMRGIPIMTGFFTLVGFSWLCLRIAKKHSVIKDDIGKNKKGLIITIKSIDPDALDLTDC